MTTTSQTLRVGPYRVELYVLVYKTSPQKTVEDETRICGFHLLFQS